MKTTYIGLTDPSIRLGDGDVLSGERVVVQSAIYGRLIFTPSPAVEVIGRGVQIRNCVFDGGGLSVNG